MLLQHQMAKHAGCIQHDCAVCSHFSVDTYSTVSLLPPSLLLLVLLQATLQQTFNSLSPVDAELIASLRCMCTAQKYNGCSVLVRQLDAHVE